MSSLGTGGEGSLWTSGEVGTVCGSPENAQVRKDLVELERDMVKCPQQEVTMTMNWRSR